MVEDAEFLEQLQMLEKHNGDGDLRELCVERVCCYALLITLKARTDQRSLNVLASPANSPSY